MDGVDLRREIVSVMLNGGAGIACKGFRIAALATKYLLCGEKRPHKAISQAAADYGIGVKRAHGYVRTLALSWKFGCVEETTPVTAKRFILDVAEKTAENIFRSEWRELGDGQFFCRA